MWQIDRTPGVDVPDLAALGATLDAHASFFDRHAPIIAARAPGRLDVMGGIADYSGSLVLQLPLAAATFVAAQPDDEPRITIRSLAAPGIDAQPEVTLPLAALVPGGVPVDYATARALFAAEPRRRWAGYVAGALVVLAHERGLRLTGGLRLLIDSAVPVGKGVSSSAALEVATMQAVCALYDLRLAGREVALLSQLVENQVVGAPCGVMDQMTAACGEQDRLLALLCQPAELQDSTALPPELEVWGIDSGIRHAVSGTDYGAVRVGAFMGYRILAEIAGLSVAVQNGRVTIADRPWRGYLANVAPSIWEARFRDRLPAELDGADFLERYGGTTDPVTRVDPRRRYVVRQPTAHPIYEHHRVGLFRALLASPPDEQQRRLLGELMYQSHASYSACGLGSDGTDRLVELARAAGPAAGVYGAKITGGGSGGTVAVLARRDAAACIDEIACQYERETGRGTTILRGSSPGAAAVGAFRLIWR